MRQHFGQTQREFAALLAVHHDTLGLWERGSHEPPRMALTLSQLHPVIHAVE
jgi:DNA-binding transcriptional regulator YiaG